MLLLERHRALLTTQVAINITGRLLSFGLVVLVALSNRFSRLSEFLLFSLAAVVVGFFWGYFARTNEEQLSQLEEIIVQGNDIGRDTTNSKRTDVADAENDHQEQPSVECDNYSMRDTKEADRWRQIYIEWKHEAWKYPNRERLMRLEPLAWFVLVLAFLTVKLVFGVITINR